MLESQQQILDQLNVDKTVYQVKSDVKSLFIAVVLLDEQTQVIKSYQNRLQAKCDELKAQVDEGAALATALDRLRVEMIKSDQQLEEIQIQRKAYLSNLQLLTGADFSGEIVLTVKSPEIDGTKQKRLEYDFMTATQQKLELSKKLIDAQKLPRLSAFAQGGYGRPGLNYLTNDFAGYWIVGVQFNWKIINWNQFNNQKKMNDILISSVEADKVNFERNVELALSRMRADIEKWNALLLRDPQLISLRKSVAENAGHELNQGIITTSAWVDELQQLTQAEIDMKIHEIQLINSKLDYLNIQGKL
jgi:outer membrane protein TolC